MSVHEHLRTVEAELRAFDESHITEGPPASLANAIGALRDAVQSIAEALDHIKDFEL
jgi:hypothetical protein